VIALRHGGSGHVVTPPAWPISETGQVTPSRAIADAISRSSIHTNATPALGCVQPSKRSATLGVGAVGGSRVSPGWQLPAT
jgi:hypothetical protein